MTARARGPSHADRRQLATRYLRNGFGEVIRRTSLDSGNTDNLLNPLGLVIQATDARGVVTVYDYDEL